MRDDKHGDAGGHGHAWGWRDLDFGAFGSGGGRWRHRRRGGRVFEQGDLRFMILRLLEEKPRHGYDIIREVEERSGGRYAPSPGAVYPTLTMLEDMGYAAGTAEEGGRKVYAITDDGRHYLAANSTIADDVVERLADLGASIFGDSVRPAHEAMARLGRAYWRAAMRHSASPERVASVTAILDRARTELEALLGTK